MQIIGSGNISSSVSGSNTIYTATPNTGFSFKYWTYGNSNHTENPLTVPTETVIDSVTFYYAISSYLKGMVGFKIEDANLIPILSRRSEYWSLVINLETDIAELSSSQKDLLYADVLMWGATSPSMYGSIQDSDGGWTHQEGASTINAADKKRFEDTAKTIYTNNKDTLNLRPSIIIHSL